MNEPTPEEAAAALRVVHAGKQRVIKSALGARWIWIAGGVIVFLYSTAIDLFPALSPWLTWSVVGVCLVAVVVLRTRVGGTLLGRPVTVSSRSLSVSLKWRLLRVAPIFAIAIAMALIINVFRVPHGLIYYGALAGLYLTFLGPRFQLWLLRRQDRGPR